MHKFTDFVGTPLQESVIPIIPAGVKLRPSIRLAPDRVGKFPGRPYSDGWGSFPWQKVRATPEMLETWDHCYEEEGLEPIIGLQTRLVTAIDIGTEDKDMARTFTEHAVKVFGPPLIRVRPNSCSRLLLYRSGGAIPNNLRRVWENAVGVRTALQALGDGQWCVVYGRHPSGVDYEWLDGRGPLEMCRIGSRSAQRGVPPEAVWRCPSPNRWRA